MLQPISMTHPAFGLRHLQINPPTRWTPVNMPDSKSRYRFPGSCIFSGQLLFGLHWITSSFPAVSLSSFAPLVWHYLPRISLLSHLLYLIHIRSQEKTASTAWLVAVPGNLRSASLQKQPLLMLHLLPPIWVINWPPGSSLIGNISKSTFFSFLMSPDKVAKFDLTTSDPHCLM